MQVNTDEITWVLRRETEGWRVGGMVVNALPDWPPTLLNFEDPTDMLRQQQLLQEEIQRRQANANLQVQRPPGGESPIQR